MNLKNLTNENLISIGLDLNKKEDVIKHLVKNLYKEGKITSEEEFYKDVLEREKLSPTGFEAGLAVPHGKSKSVKEASFAVATIKKPIKDWESIDENNEVDLIFLLGSIYLFSKVPFLERWQMYQQIRYGKTKWGFIQIGKIVLSSFSYVFVIFMLSFLALAKNLHYEKGWGKVLYTLALTDAGEIYEEEFPISYQLINDNKVPIFIFGKTILIISLIVMTIGLLMYLISICFSRLVAIIITIMFSIFPIMIEEADIQIQRLLVEVIPTEWIKIYKIGNTYNTVQSPDWNTIIVRLIILNVLLSIFIIYRIHKMEFNWYGEE